LYLTLFTNNNRHSSSLAAFGTATWISVEQASVIMNVSVAELTPDKFLTAYEAAWNGAHPTDMTTTTATSGGAVEREFSGRLNLLIGLFGLVVSMW